jgi:hypothetical protein
VRERDKRKTVDIFHRINPQKLNFNALTLRSLKRKQGSKQATLLIPTSLDLFVDGRKMALFPLGAWVFLSRWEKAV